MKKIIFILVLIIVVGLSYFFTVYKIQTVCFGDLCPQNGGTYLFYRATLTEEECTNRGGNPVVGIGWTRVYAGCSPFKY